MRILVLALSLLAFAVAASCHAGDVVGVFARAKAASGGDRWDSLRSVREEGVLATGGMQGTIHSTTDLRDGRTSDRFRLGPVEGADGYDGRVAWEKDPGGEVATLDAPDALRRARSQAWLDAHGYWFPQRMPATYGELASKVLDGRRYDVVVATPQGGDPVTLWFDGTTGLLARVQRQHGSDTGTTVYDDYRLVDGVRIAFHAASDRTDAAGHTDPREHLDIRFERVVFDAAVADADFAVPAMAATARIDDPSGHTTIPFDLVNNHIYVDGRIDGKPARLLVDTGGSNLLTPAAAKKFGIAGTGKLAGSGVGDQKVDVSLGHAKEVRVGAAVLAKPVFLILDLGALPKVEGVAADGLVGYEMFRRFGVEIDYAHHRLVLSEPAKFTPPAGATAVPFTLADRIPVVAGSLDGVPMRISIDTGSRASITLHAPFARANHLAEKYRAAPNAVMGWGVGGPSRGRPARLGTLMLGQVRIDGLAGDLYTGDKGAFANPDLSANLGGGALRRFDVAFDYGRKLMYLAPDPARAGIPDAFDRSGLWLLADGDAFKVVDVADGSAAQRAGMKDGDRILTIGGEPIAAHGLADWRERLRTTPAGTRLAILFVRDDKEQAAELVLADRIPTTTPGAAAAP